MGWLWTSQAPQIPTKPTESVDDGNINLQEAPPAAISDAVKRTLSREEQADEDLAVMIKEFQQEANTKSDERAKSRESGVLSHTTPLPEDISPDSLYPSTIHCQSAFDYAMFCQSFGGQFVNVYRYGSFRSCAPLWSDFWLCMRTRQWDEKDRAKAIRERHREKAIKFKTGPSSEEIWQVRSEPVRDAFQDSLEELEEQIQKWKLANPDAEDPWEKSAGQVMKIPKAG